jgi:hypothetical protein
VAAPPPAATPTEPEPEAKPRKASFLDPHPPGYLPALYATDERVHQGISVRVSAGLGFGSTRHKLTRGSYKVSGLEGILSLDIGATVIDNLIVFGRISGFAWNSLRESDSANAGGSYLGMVGAGARYYLMPHNAFASAALGLAATQVLDDLGNSKNANPGFGFELEVGRDFWAGTPLDRRAVGLSLRFGYVTCGAAAPKDSKAFNSYAISLLFSAAYN